MASTLTLTSADEFVSDWDRMYPAVVRPNAGKQNPGGAMETVGQEVPGMTVGQPVLGLVFGLVGGNALGLSMRKRTLAEV